MATAITTNTSGVAARSFDVLNPKLLWIWGGVWAIAMVGMLGFGLTAWLGSDTSFDDQSYVTQTLIFVPIVWIALSVHIIQFEEIAAVSMFGKAVTWTGPGFKLIPAGLFKVVRYLRTTQQEQFPADPELIFGGHDDEPLPEGMKRPFRVMTGKPKKKQNMSELDIQMAVEFQYYLRVQIEDPFVFAIQFSDFEGFWRQMRDTGDRVITRYVAETAGVGDLIANIAELMRLLQDAFQEKAGNAVEIIESGLNSPDISQRLSAAIRDIGVARASATATKVSAEAEQYRLTKEGEGRAAAEAALIEAIDEKLAKANDATKIAITGERVLGDKTVVLGADGMAQAFGLGKMITSKGDNN